MYKKLFSIIILKILLILIIFFSCPSGDSSSSGGGSGGGGNGSGDNNGVTINIEYTKGTADNLDTRTIIYVAWIENQSVNYIQNLYVCNRVLDIGAPPLAAHAIPYWYENKYPSDVTGVTGATKKNQDFTVTGTLADNSIQQFTIYMEVDHSFDNNDWYTDQPALLYSAVVDLTNLQPEYVLLPIGWTRNDGTGGSSNEFLIATGHTSPAVGLLQTDMRYIKNQADSSISPYGFGSEYADNTPATNIVGTLKAIVTVN